MTFPTTVVVGAGPFGLSVAAHLRRHGLAPHIVGRPMQFWRDMPAGMLLKSPWSASSLSDPAGASTLAEFVRQSGRTRVEPVPLDLFVEYGMWFQRREVGEVDETMVREIAPIPDGFRVELSDGRAHRARHVVVATGIRTFPHIPAFAHGLRPELCTHTVALRRPAAFAGAEVVVVGAGQSALESAALLVEAGARVEVVARGPVRWTDRRLLRVAGPLRHLLYPASDVGPVGLSWIVAAPGLVRSLPAWVRTRLGDRAVRPAGARWLRHRVESRVTLTEWTEVRGGREHAGRLELTLSDGTTRGVDHLVLGTGYRARIADLGHLAPDLARRIAVDARGYPVLDGALESSVPGLHFAGALAAGTFGPLCRFVAGTGPAARRVGARLRAAV